MPVQWILAQAQAPQESFLDNKLFLAGVAAVLSFASALAVSRLTARTSRKLLTWTVEVNSKIVTLPPDLADHVQIRYQGREADNLTNVKYVVTNDGKQGVRKGQLRFPFPDDTVILEFAPDPEPEKEVGLQAVESSPTEETVKFEYLAPGQSLAFRIIASGGDWLGWSGARSYNEIDDVEFQRKDTVASTDDRQHIRPFVIWGLLLFLAPSFGLRGLVGDFGTALGVLISLLFFLLFLPHIAPVARIIQQVAFTRLDEQARRPNFHASGDNSIIVLGDRSTVHPGGGSIGPGATS